MQDNLMEWAQHLIESITTPHLDKHRTQQKRIEKYYSPRDRFNRWRDSNEGQVWKQQQFEAHDGKCPDCGFKLPTIDHFVIDHIAPLRSHPHLAIELSNLRLLCHPCNLTKGSGEVSG